MRIYYSLYDRLLARRALARAFEKVRRAQGAPGVDGQTIVDFQSRLLEELDQLVSELRNRSYQPQPVRRVSIPKPDGGERHLGIPAVRDRVVQQALLEILQPIFDPQFHPSSYGYRPGRSCQQAVAKATMFIRRYGRRHVVDMDLSKCFDRLDHDLIIASIRRRVTDGSILTLVRMFLTSGVMVEGNWEATETGSPQGGVVSPLIANIYLDAFDQEMKRRGHRLVRYADDILILCRSESAAHQALQTATAILEEDLKLTVNRVIADLNPVLRGFANYFRMANCKGVFGELAGWIRRRLRSKQLSLWKKPQRLYRRLRQLGYGGDLSGMRMRSWRSSRSHLASWSISNAWLSQLGLFDLSAIPAGVLPQVTSVQ